jgi:ankyrin repeat protein
MNNIQKQFHQAIENNDIKNVKLLLNQPKVNPAYNNNSAIIYASMEGYYDIVELLINDHRVNPAADDNSAIIYTSKEGHYHIVKLLLNHPKVDPADYNNWSIINAFSEGHYDIVNLLWQDQRVKNSLKKDHEELYNKLVKKDKIKTF